MPATKKKKVPIKKKPIARLWGVTIPDDFSMADSGISQSMLQAFLACRLRFLLKVNKWGHVSKNKATLLGSLVHDMLEKVYKQWRKRNTIPRDSTIEKWIEAWPADLSDIMGVSEDELELARTKAFVLITEYVRYYSEDFGSKKWTDVETTFDVRWEGYRLVGKRDGRFEVSTRPWLFETKTKSRIVEDGLMLRLAYDLQNQFYIVADEAENQEQIAGVLYNVVRNPGHRMSAGEDLGDLAEKIRSDIKARPEHFFKRYEIPYTIQDKKRFKGELALMLRDMNKFVSGMRDGTIDFPYRQSGNCEAPYPCDFPMACATGNLTGFYKSEKLHPELTLNK